MSDNESGDSKGDTSLWNGSSSNSSDSICRDFLRNVCRRGSHCRYRHPEPSEAKELGKKFDYVFCHDFQNKECRRNNCKFLHCTQEEEEYYRSTGELPQHVLDAIAKGNQERASSKGDVPICKDYLKGECLRGGRCRFRHVNPDYENDGCNSAVSRLRRDRFDRFERGSDFDGYEPEVKRRAYDALSHFEYDGSQRDGDQGPILSNTYAPDYRVLQEENMILRRKLEEYKKQVAHLTATNEFLLDQNAQLRLSKQTTTVSPVTQTLNPHTITVTPTPLPPPITPISQQLSMNTGDLTAAQNTLTTQRIAPELAAPPPQNIAPMVPVTLAQALAPVSIAPVSIAQAIPAVSLSQSLPQSIITLSSASTSLVSYPIMTQSLRPVIPHSLGH